MMLSGRTRGAPTRHRGRRRRARGDPGRTGRAPLVARQRFERPRRGQSRLIWPTTTCTWRSSVRARSSGISSLTRRKTPTTATRASTSTSRRRGTGGGLGTDAVRTLATHLIDDLGHHRLNDRPRSRQRRRDPCVREGGVPARRRHAPLRAGFRRHLARQPAHGPARGRAAARPAHRVSGASITSPPMSSVTIPATGCRPPRPSSSRRGARDRRRAARTPPDAGSGPNIPACG